MKKRSTLKRMMCLMLLAAVILFRPGAGLNVLAQEPQSAAGTAVQTDVSAQEAAAAAQAEADALMAAHLAAWQIGRAHV